MDSTKVQVGNFCSILETKCKRLLKFAKSKEFPKICYLIAASCRVLNSVGNKKIFIWLLSRSFMGSLLEKFSKGLARSVCIHSRSKKPYRRIRNLFKEYNISPSWFFNKNIKSIVKLINIYWKIFFKNKILS